MTAKKYIKKQQRKIIADAVIKMSCIHEWQQCGHGYKCDKCGYYCGNEKLNKMIEKSL